MSICRTLGTAATLALLLAGCQGVAQSDPTIGQRASKNAQMAFSVNMLRMAAEQYATDHQGHYPTPAGFTNDMVVSKALYLPGRQMPQNPFDGAISPLVVAPAPANRLPALPKVGDPVPAWIAPARAGTLAYCVNDKRDAYEIVGLGEVNGQVVVSASAITE